MKNFKTITLLLLIIFCVIAVSDDSFAQIDGSPHDMIGQEYFKPEDIDKKSNCTYCHLSYKELGYKVWRGLPPEFTQIGKMGAICYSCHDGVTVVDINVDASRTAFSPLSHGLDLTKLPEGDSLQNVPLKYITSDLMECTTCHAPHKNENRPFLATSINQLCNYCHRARRNSGFGRDNSISNHPVSVEPIDVKGGASPINADSIFKTEFPSPYPTAGARYSKTGHWDLGGHLSGGGVGTMECFTCHSVHGNELEGPNENLLAVDPIREINDEFCEGCHKGERGDDIPTFNVFPNPGGTTGERTYHPCDDDLSNGEGDIVEVTYPEGWPVGSRGKKIICSTCHDVHNGKPNSPVLRATTEATFCEECHKTLPLGHHQSGPLSNPSGRTLATNASWWFYAPDSDWQNGDPSIILEADPASNGYGITFGDPVKNKIYCSSCHRAHNAGNGVEKKASPSLVIANTASQLCLLCHSKENVAFNDDDMMRASHFIGDPTLESTYAKEPFLLHL